MKNVKRGQTPDSLRMHSGTWTRELLDIIKKNTTSGSTVSARLYNRYKQKDVLDTLESMYGDGVLCYCCYCESVITTVSYAHIEHRKPKASHRFPELTFDWDNLHLACQLCNNAKSDQWDDAAPILDAVADVPISQHLGYKLGATGVYREELTSRGHTTVQHADLDRRALLQARLRVYAKTLQAILEIKSLGKNPKAYTAARMLRDESSGEFGSLIDWLADTWGIPR